VFLGEYRHALDDKGRLFIPARFRNRENQRFFVTRGLEKCLFAFPEEEWEKQRERVAGMDMMKRDARAFNRFFFSGTAEVICDRQGRINLPQHLLEYAGLAKDAVVIGVSNRFEIWSALNWTGYEAESAQRYEEIAENLVE